MLSEGGEENWGGGEHVQSIGLEHLEAMALWDQSVETQRMEALCNLGFPLCFPSPGDWWSTQTAWVSLLLES